ncbi:ATP-binding protein [Hyalangium rubrum]|uniref:histidine kinase n=1 Tax=Hyalangium rubrum TaxID=3103134 RepID=A0ABU5GUS4_9BACT|nr:ATP-binding protein [Hyalangium sp. s54d21]MDY7224933.1 ATP-binding protein [Hyalangium sp. s54d21]
MSAVSEPRGTSAPLEEDSLLRELMEVERDNPEGCLLLGVVLDAAGSLTDFECHYGNPAAQELLGATEAKLTGRQLRKVLPERDLGGWFALLCSVEASGQPVSADLPDSRAGIELGNWFHCTAMKMRRFILARFRNVTPARRTASALEETRNRMVEILEGTPDAFCSVDENWNFSYINANTQEISGKEREPMLGNSLWKAWPEMLGTVYEQNFQRVMRERVMVRFEHPLPPDHYYEVQAYPSGRGISIFFREIREQKHLENERDALLAREHSARLEAEALAQQRARELLAAQEKLVQSEKLAVAGQLAAGVGHEINNPLSFVIGNIHFALEQLATLPPELLSSQGYHESLDALREASVGAERIRGIVMDLKRFARADESHMGPVDVWEALEFSLSMALPHIRHRAQVERRFSPVPKVLANEAKLGQVFLNLLVNAADAIPEGDVARHRITLSTRMENERVVVEVSDTGRGMTPEVLERAFEPFFTTKTVGAGTGLGLSICLGLVQGMKGELSATSRLGIGSTFRVVLPPAKELARNSTPMTVVAAHERKRVLVVDDEPGIAAVFRRIIGRLHEVVVVQSGREALALLEQDDAFDRIFCDLMMPDLTGMDVYEALAQWHPDCLERFVFMTGGGFTERARTFLQTVPTPRIDKPFEPALIRQLIAQSPSRTGT